MYRIRPVQHALLVTSPARLQRALRSQKLPLASRTVHGKTINHVKISRRLRGYASSAIFFGAVSLGLIWISYPSPSKTQGILDERSFQPFTIASKEPVSPTSSVFTLRPRFQPSSDPYASFWARGIWSVEFKQPQLQIARSYTPLPPTEASAPGDLRFLIRKEHKGEVSNYLDRLPIGATVDVRGPRVEYEIPENVSNVLFLAGGTGIAPALQVMHTLLKQRSNNGGSWKQPSIHVLWANRRREDCIGGGNPVTGNWWRSSSPILLSHTRNIIVQELQDLEKGYKGQVEINYLVDEEGSFIDKTKILRITTGRSDPNPEAVPAHPVTKLLLISGPEGFVNFFAGPKEWGPGKQVQGPLRGLLGCLRLNDWTVAKL